jgi:hypothetical protein
MDFGSAAGHFGVACRPNLIAFERRCLPYFKRDSLSPATRERNRENPTLLRYANGKYA